MGFAVVGVRRVPVVAARGVAICRTRVTAALMLLIVDGIATILRHSLLRDRLVQPV